MCNCDIFFKIDYFRHVKGFYSLYFKGFLKRPLLFEFFTHLKTIDNNDDREGEVIFKKYSPIGELSSFASQYAETLYKTCNLSVIISDRDAVIASAGVSKKEYSDKNLSEEAEKIIESRGFYSWREGADRLPVIADSQNHFIRCAMPIISEGDVIGCVASVADRSAAERRDPVTGGADTEAKLIQAAAGFLGRHTES